VLRLEIQREDKADAQTGQMPVALDAPDRERVNPAMDLVPVVVLRVPLDAGCQYLLGEAGVLAHVTETRGCDVIGEGPDGQNVPL
jgi:hypothetical protein